jgi:phosphopantothenoylcysteine decarboxylase/phosphopantothenate--cysteine ligase
MIRRMNCIVTAGPTYEPLDEVRRLTNFSTGRLGAGLAGFLTAHGHTVTLLMGELAVWPGERRAQTVRVFSTTQNLRAQLKALARRKVEVIFHAAAVSDFAFGALYSRTERGRLAPFRPTKKIPTRAGRLCVELVPTPKIIAELRAWYPRARIVGWKFEADGGRADVLRLARKQLADCGTDACVANGPAYGRGFGLVAGGRPRHFASPEKLYAGLAAWLEQPGA